MFVPFSWIQYKFSNEKVKPKSKPSPPPSDILKDRLGNQRGGE
jgi:hypothetical protein